MRRTNMKLMCDGELINEHSQKSGMSNGWSNPIEVLPPIGSHIEYLTFNQGSEKGEGVLKTYLVKSICFKTEEGYNNSYTNEACIIELEELSSK